MLHRSLFFSSFLLFWVSVFFLFILFLCNRQEHQRHEFKHHVLSPYLRFTLKMICRLPQLFWMTTPFLLTKTLFSAENNWPKTATKKAQCTHFHLIIFKEIIVVVFILFFWYSMNLSALKMLQTARWTRMNKKHNEQILNQLFKHIVAVFVADCIN